MKFAMSYSCGKDSTLALHKMIEQGHEPVCLVVMVNEAASRSYFHAADGKMLEHYAKALDLPLVACPANGSGYGAAFEKGLMEAKKMGTEAACFGDIDIEQNRQWEEGRCKAAGLVPCFPLWKQVREKIVYEIVPLGYKCLIKSVNQTVLPTGLLGTIIDKTSISVMESAGIDICGENGEYHTLVVDGPIFQEPLCFQLGGKIEFGDYAAVDIR